MRFTINNKTYENGHISSVYKYGNTMHVIVVPEPICCDNEQITIDKEEYHVVSNKFVDGFTSLVVTEKGRK